MEKKKKKEPDGFWKPGSSGMDGKVKKAKAINTIQVIQESGWILHVYYIREVILVRRWQIFADYVICTCDALVSMLPIFTDKYIKS